jgi:hypothetical protein
MQQSLVHELVLATGCDEKLAHIILEFTDEDMDKAKRIIFAIPKDIVVLTVKFSGNRSGRHGLVLHIYNQTTRSLEYLTVLLSRDKAVLEMPDDENVQRLIKNLEELRGKEPDEEHDTKLIEEYLNRSENADPLKRILDEQNPDDVKMLQFFNDILFRVLADANLTIRFTVNRIDSFQLNRGENPVPLRDETGDNPSDAQAEKKSEEPEEEKKSEYRNESVIIMAAQALIAPVEGTPIPKFKPGDVIFTDIIDQREIAVYLKKLLIDEQSEKTGKIPAVIEEMDYASETENVSIIVKYGPGIYGRVIVHRDVRIDAPGRQAVKPEEKPAGSYNWIVWVFIIAVVLLVIIMTLSKGR